MASKVLKKSNAKLKFLYRQSRQLTSAHRRLLCNKLITKHFNYGCSSWFLFFKEKFKTQTSKSPKLMCSLFPRFTSDISYRFITLQKNKLASCWRRSNGFVPGYIQEMFKPSIRKCSTISQIALEILLWKNIYLNRQIDRQID